MVLSVVLLLLLAGTFADLPIDEALYNRDSAFGHFFAVAAMIPIWTLIPMSAGLMFGALLTQFGGMGKAWRVICIALLLFGIYTTYKLTAGFYGSRHLHGLSFQALIAIVIAAFLSSTALGAHASHKYPREVLMAAVVGIVAVAGGRMLLDVFKDMWGRQRFWTMNDPATQFTAWYRPQFPSAERMAEMGDKIKSFPSGHSCGAISVLWLSMFPAFLDPCQKNHRTWGTGIAVFALCFWTLVMVSRLVLGEHFLSDVSMSAIIFLIGFIVMDAMVAQIQRERQHR